MSSKEGYVRKKTKSNEGQTPKRKTKKGETKKDETKCRVKKDLVFLDNNSTTLMCSAAVKVQDQWSQCYNASSDSKISKPARAMIEKARDLILHRCKVSSATHTAIFTSGATESNCFVIRACVKAYKKKLAEKNSYLRPHLILSAIEHHSSMECAKDLVECGDADVSYITPTIYGNILAEDVEEAIKPNTCLISIMYANNEIPTISNITEIGEIAHQHRIPLHSDCVQIFGKMSIDIMKDNIDALSASAHKFYGPKGVGLVILNNNLIEGYKLTAEINGSQQGGLRGGTENVSAIASMLTAYQYAHTERAKKNAKLISLRNHLLDKLAKYYPFVEYDKFVYPEEYKKETTDEEEPGEEPPIEFVSLGPPREATNFILPNTVLLAICKERGKPLCNVELKKFLDQHGYTVSIGSACLTKSDKASHVLSAIGAPPIVKRGVIRISFSDQTTISDVNGFVAMLIQGIKKQLALDVR
jgi:cysteine desulfurase